MPDFTQVNWLAVIVAAIANIIIGFIWYMPQVFGRRWRRPTQRLLLARLAARHGRHHRVAGRLISSH